MITVGLLEDDKDLNVEIAEFIGGQNFNAIRCFTIAQFKEIIPCIQIALIDVNLPDGTGFSVTQELKEHHPHVGIIMITAKGELKDKIEGLSSGADHYLVKPINLKELSAYLKALKRRIQPQSWKLNLKKRQLISPQNQSEQLTFHEMIIMKLLAQNVGNIVTRMMIASAFNVEWEKYDERLLEQLMSRLRRRWKDISPLPIQTLRAQGYCFCEHIDML